MWNKKHMNLNIQLKKLLHAGEYAFSCISSLRIIRPDFSHALKLVNNSRQCDFNINKRVQFVLMEDRLYSPYNCSASMMVNHTCMWRSIVLRELEYWDLCYWSCNEYQKYNIIISILSFGCGSCGSQASMQTTILTPKNSMRS